MLAKAAVKLIKLYQFFSARLWGGQCRFYPTCSQYTIEAIEKYGILKGVAKGIARVAKCHPGHPGGIDRP